VKNIQSLERAFDILEFLSDTPEESHPLGEVAAAVGLHTATCAHLVGTMVDRGYVESAGARKGYRLGPMSHYLVRRKPLGGDLVARALPLVEAAAQQLGEWVVLTEMAGMRRLVLLERKGSPRAVQIDAAALRLAERAYDSASVWLFLAHQESAARRRFLEFHGQPEGYADTKAVEARLAMIREDGFCIYQDGAGEVAKAAYPIRQDGAVVAAVGCHLPAFRFAGEHRAAILAALEELAVQLGTGS